MDNALIEIKECPFCGKVAGMRISDMIHPSCGCFDKILNTLSGKLIPLDIWQSRPYVNVLKRKMEEMDEVIQPYQRLWIKMNRLSPTERKMIEAMVQSAWESAGKP